jgi:hypothetical protein
MEESNLTMTGEITSILIGISKNLREPSPRGLRKPKVRASLFPVPSVFLPLVEMSV